MIKPSTDTALPVEKLTGNVLRVNVGNAPHLDSRILLEQKPYAFFRRKGPDAYYIGANPYELSPRDVCVINETCDQHEGTRNKGVKQVIADSLQQHFGRKAFHITEFGSGRHPISGYLKQNANVSFRAVEQDEGCIAHLQRMNVPATTWDGALASGPAKDKPSVCVSIYALHFLADKDMGQSVGALTSDPCGFMVGNFYIHPEEGKTGAGRAKLKQTLMQQGLDHIVLKDPADRGNEYWVIGKPGCRSAMNDYAGTLRQVLQAQPAAGALRPQAGKTSAASHGTFQPFSALANLRLS